MELWKYIAKRKSMERYFTQGQFARDLGTTEAVLSRLINYEQTPSVKLCMKVQEASKGEIECWSFLRLCHEKYQEKHKNTVKEKKIKSQ